MACFDVLGLCRPSEVAAQVSGHQTEVGSERGGFWVVSDAGGVPAERGARYGSF
jgi:hypothetical protein